MDKSTGEGVSFSAIMLSLRDRAERIKGVELVDLEIRGPFLEFGLIGLTAGDIRFRAGWEASSLSLGEAVRLFEGRGCIDC